jgi:hypothetical protein
MESAFVGPNISLAWHENPQQHVRELARRLGVHETQVSRDERNEYFGITLERAAKILEKFFGRNDALRR